MNIKNFHQTPEEIIKQATAEQRLLWNFIFMQFGDRVSISQLFYMGAVAGSEFLVYRAGKLYLCYDIHLSAPGTPNGATQYFQFYNENNAINFYGTNQSVFFNVGTAVTMYSANDFNIPNIYFSRFVMAGMYNYMRFVGFRLNTL